VPQRAGLSVVPFSWFWLDLRQKIQRHREVADLDVALVALAAQRQCRHEGDALAVSGSPADSRCRGEVDVPEQVVVEDCIGDRQRVEHGHRVAAEFAFLAEDRVEQEAALTLTHRRRWRRRMRPGGCHPNGCRCCAPPGVPDHAGRARRRRRNGWTSLVSRRDGA